MSNNLKSIFITLLSILVIIILYKIFWLAYLRDYPQKIRPSLKAVIKEYYMCKITGGYWENEIENQSKRIVNLRQNDRVAFFRGVLLATSDLDTSKAVVFSDSLGEDAGALRIDLIRLKESAKFNAISKKQQQKVLNWIKELAIIVRQQGWDKEKANM
jgi:hypothetical protein